MGGILTPFRVHKIPPPPTMRRKVDPRRNPRTSPMPGLRLLHHILGIVGMPDNTHHRRDHLAFDRLNQFFKQLVCTAHRRLLSAKHSICFLTKPALHLPKCVKANNCFLKDPAAASLSIPRAGMKIVLRTLRLPSARGRRVIRREQESRLQ